MLTRPVVLSVANYGALALADIAFIAFLPLFLSTPIALGGLGLAPAAIGAILGSLGVLDGQHGDGHARRTREAPDAQPERPRRARCRVLAMKPGCK